MQVIDLSDFTQLGPTSATLSKRSFATSVFAAEIPRDTWSSAAPFAWGDEVAILHDGQLVLTGHVTRCKPDTQGDDYYWDLEISDRWERLETTTAINVINGAETSRYMVGVKDDASGVPLTVPVADVLNQVLAGAGQLLPEGCSVDVTGPASGIDWMTIPFSSSGDSFASLMQQCLDWQPDLVSYFDYNQGGKLVITDKADDRLVILDPLVNDIDSISLTPRFDLVPPVVGILGRGVSDGYRTGVVAQYPAGVSLSSPYAQIATVDIPADPEQEEDETSAVPSPPGDTLESRLAPRIRIVGREIPVDDSEKMTAWWQAKCPSLGPAFGADIKVGRTRLLPSTPDMDLSRYPNYSQNAEFELISGEINSKTKTIKWGERIVESYITINNPPADLKSRFPKRYKETGNIWQGVMRGRLRTTNVRLKAYDLDADATEYDIDEEEEESSAVPEPPPDLPVESYDGLCRTVYQATRRIPYEGPVVLNSRIDLNRISGATLAIVNDRPEYATMRAIVQTVDYDLITGKTTLTLGPPEQVGLQDMINRRTRIQGQQDRTKQDTAANDERGDTPSGGSWWDWDAPPKKADFPSVVPWFELETSSASQPLDADFSVRLVYNDESKVEAVDIHQGWVHGPRNKMQAGESEWTRMYVTSGEIYVNVTVDHDGKITGADFATGGAGGWEAEPFVKARTAYTREEFDVRDNHVGNEGSYSYLVATIKGEQVTHHILGAIAVSILPMQLIYEVRDFDWDPNNQGSQTDVPDETLAPGETEVPGETITPYSLIDTWEHDHVLLKKIAADPKATPIQVWVPGQSEPIKIDARIKITKREGILRIGIESGTFVPTPSK